MEEVALPFDNPENVAFPDKGAVSMGLALNRTFRINFE
jgi:hypothetical protein